MRLIAPHILQRYDGDLGNPPAIKIASAAFDVAYVRGLIERYPTTPFILRFIDEAFSWATPFASANAWLNRHAAEMAAMNAPNVLWEFLNEVPDGLADPYATASVTWLLRMHGAGYRCVWPSSSVGTPDLAIQHFYNPVLQKLRADDGCAPHEYLGDSVDSAMPWYVTRFTKWPEMMRHDLYIGETGSDANTPGGQAGWRKTFGGNLDAYMAQLVRLDEVYRQYPNVKAAFVFSIGQTQFGWDNFNLDWDRVVALQEEAPVTPRVGKPPFRLGPIFDRWAGYPITTRHGESLSGDGKAPFHKGTDFAAPEGTPLRAPFRMRIDICGWGGPNGDRGNYVIGLDEEQMVEAMFVHLQERPQLERDDIVEKGAVFAHTGNTGVSTGPHLHFRVISVKDTPDWPFVADYDPAGPDVVAA